MSKLAHTGGAEDAGQFALAVALGKQRFEAKELADGRSLLKPVSISLWLHEEFEGCLPYLDFNGSSCLPRCFSESPG